MSEFVRKYRYPLGGAVIGLVLAAMIVTIGFFKTILALVIIVLGAYAGLYVQRTGMLDQFFNSGFFSNLKNSVVNSDSVTDGVNVEVGKKQVAVDLDIVAEYQKHVPTIFADIKKVVEAEVKRMTDLEVVEVNVNVVDIKTRAQHEEDSVTLQDRVTNAAQATGEFASNQVSNVKSAVGSGVDKVEDMKSEPRVQ